MKKIAAVLVFTFLAVPAFGSEQPGRRLIETAPGQRQWMTLEQMGTISQKQHEAGKCAGFFDVTEHQDWNWSDQVALAALFPRVPSQQKLVSPLLPEVSAQNILATVEKLSSYKNRYYQNQSGADAAVWLSEQFKAIANGRTDISVQLFKHNFKQPSVIATIQGTGTHASERVVIGGHEDSIQGFGGGANMNAPGADDDASGAATVLEVFRVLVASGLKFDRTLEFMTYAGEEAGLLGSQDIARKYKANQTAVYAVMQFDMTMYAGTGKQLTLITDFVNKDLTKFTEMLIDEYVKMPWSESQCGYGCSDHASWTKAGYASVFPFESKFDDYNQQIHTSSDRLDILDHEFGAHFARLGVAFMAEMSTGD